MKKEERRREEKILKDSLMMFNGLDVHWPQLRIDHSHDVYEE
jgi:hypothetical protein